MKGRQDRQHGDSGADPLGQGDTVLDSFPGEFRPIRWYQDIGIHRLSLIRTGAIWLMPTQFLRVERNPNQRRDLHHYRLAGIFPDESQIGMTTQSASDCAAIWTSHQSKRATPFSLVL